MFKFPALLITVMKSVTLGKWFHLFQLVFPQVWKGSAFFSFCAACRGDGSAQNKIHSEHFEILVVGSWALLVADADRQSSQKPARAQVLGLCAAHGGQQFSFGFPLDHLPSPRRGQTSLPSSCPTSQRRDCGHEQIQGSQLSHCLSRTTCTRWSCAERPCHLSPLQIMLTSIC